MATCSLVFSDYDSMQNIVRICNQHIQAYLCQVAIKRDLSLLLLFVHMSKFLGRNKFVS